jgi:hypothetical protein
VASRCDPITSNLYDDAQKDALPDTAVLASLGCGNPTALDQLSAGETVLDLGSGGGIDVLLSARRVGPTGKAALLSERRKCGHDFIFFHVSTIIEVRYRCQWPPLPCFRT